MVRVQSPMRVLLVALALGWVTDFLFYGRSLGISVPIFVALLLGALFALGRVEGVHISRNVWLLVPLSFFAVMVFVRANATLTLLNTTTVLVLLSLIFFFYASDRIERLGVLGYPIVVALAAWHTLTQAKPAVIVVARDSSGYRQQMRRATPMLRGVLFALPVLALFTYLLSSADSIFSGYLEKLFQYDSLLAGLPERIWRQIIVLIAAWVIAGALLYALTRHHGPQEGEARFSPFGAVLFDRSTGFIEGATVLVLVNLLFAIFAWIQFTNIFFGQPASMPYEAYREYVRHGFGELLVVAVLTIALIIGLRHLVWKETEKQVGIFNLLCTLMIAFGIVMLVSAFMRMLVWESVQFYVNTPLRLYVRAFILWLGVTFLWLLFTSWRNPQRFAVGAFVAALGFLITINFMNPDADVAAYNLARNNELSARYLYLLSEDAVPAMADRLDQSTGAVHTSLREELTMRLIQMEHDPDRQSWPSFHLARWQAYERLVELRDAGKLDLPIKQSGHRERPYSALHIAQ